MLRKEHQLCISLVSAFWRLPALQAPLAHPYDFGLEFLDPPRSPFYAYASGRNSPYGEQTLALLRSLAERRGLSCDHYAEVFAATFGEGFDGYRDVSTKVWQARVCNAWCAESRRRHGVWKAWNSMGRERAWCTVRYLSVHLQGTGLEPCGALPCTLPDAPEHDYSKSGQGFWYWPV